MSLRVPALRERAEDIPVLLEHFLRRFAGEATRRRLRWSESALRVLSAHSWPGNVRELANVVERAVVLADDEEIGIDDLPEEIVDSSTAVSSLTPAAGEVPPYHEAVTEAKRAIIREALRRTNGHQTKAAELLGMRQPYLARLMKNLGLRS